MKKRKPPLGLFDTIAMGQQIKALCKEKGLKPGDVSEAVGIGTVQSIYKWYRGEVIPEIEHLYLLSRLLGTTVDELLIVHEHPR